MYVITLDGPSKVGKTCVARNMCEMLAPELGPAKFGPVAIAVAGDFFRRMTVACMEEVGSNPEDRELLSQLGKVIKQEVAFDDEWGWTDEMLHTRQVDDLVSRVGEHGIAQDSDLIWYETTALRALNVGKQTLIVDGRNPRARLENVLRKPEVDLVLDLFIDCEVAQAVRRNPDIKPEHWPIEIAKLTERRRLDAEREDFPMMPQDPFGVVLSQSDDQEYLFGVVDSSHHDQQRLRQVYFDTTEVALQPVLDTTSSLAMAALQWYNER